MVEIPYCEENGNASKHFIEKFEAFTNHRLKSLFKVKSENPHPSCVIYRGKCPCGDEYIGEIERNLEKRWSEHKNPTEKTEPARHLSDNNGHLFVWEILMPAPKDNRTHKNLEAFLLQFKNHH